MNKIVVLCLPFILLIACNGPSDPINDGQSGNLSSSGSLVSGYNRVAVLGDSISAGVNPQHTGYGWVHILDGQGGGVNPPAKINTIYTLFSNVLFSNYAIGNSTAAQWSQPAFIQDLLDFVPDLTIVFIGGNDVLSYIGDGIVTASEYSNLQTNISIILDHLTNTNPDMDILLVDYYDLFDGLSSTLSAVPAFSSYQTMSTVTTEGVQLISNIANAYNCNKASLYDNFIGHCYGADLGGTGISPDYVNRPITTSFDIHPVTAGHEKIYDIIYAELQVMSN